MEIVDTVLRNPNRNRFNEILCGASFEELPGARDDSVKSKCSYLFAYAALLATDDIKDYMMEYTDKPKSSKVTADDIPTWAEFTGDEGLEGNQNTISQRRFKWNNDNKKGHGLEAEKLVGYR